MRRIVELIVTATLLLLASVSAFAKDTLNAGERLLANQYLQSLNGSYKLYLQGDGNLVLRNAASSALWASGTNGKGAVRLEMQGDGNLVLRTLRPARQSGQPAPMATAPTAPPCRTVATLSC
jgi:hypothetical protein